MLPNPLLIGTTGDYKPMSFYNKDSQKYEGYDINLSNDLGKFLGVNIQFVPTTWQTLSQDLLQKKFHIAISGITITPERKAEFLISDGYMSLGKTILCRKEEETVYKTIQDINKPQVTVIVNPGGTNQAFAEQFLPDAKVLIHNQNEEIPGLIASGKADIMLTETVEAAFYAKEIQNLSAPLLATPFTHSQFGILIHKDYSDLLPQINAFLKTYPSL